MEELTLLLGSNLGDRIAHIKAALECLDEAFGPQRLSLSPVIETAACDFEGPDFLNCAVRYAVSVPPVQVLARCKEIERRLGRTDLPQYDDTGRRIYHNRIIDIDILTYGDRRIDTPVLKVPHPQIVSRPFVSRLLAEMTSYE